MKIGLMFNQRTGIMHDIAVLLQDGDKCLMDVPVQDGDKFHVSLMSLMLSCAGASMWHISPFCTGTAIRESSA